MAPYTPFRVAVASGIAKSQKRSRFLREVHKELLSGRPSFHSGMGGTLCYHVALLEEARIPYTISAFPGKGYELRVGATLTHHEEKKDG